MTSASTLTGAPRTLAAQLPHAAPGQQVRLEGWVHRRRFLGVVTFLILRDRSGLAQVVVREQHARELVQDCGEETVVFISFSCRGGSSRPPRSARTKRLRSAESEIIAPAEEAAVGLSLVTS